MWQRRSSRMLLNHPRLQVIEDQVQLPDGVVVPYLRYKGGDGVTIVCRKDNQILVQREYSYPVNEILLQFPGGKINKNESPLAAAKRELIEESGLEAGTVDLLGWYYPNNRRTNAKMYVIVANTTKEVQKIGGDHEEAIESFWLPIAGLKRMIGNGDITNYSILAAWALFEQKAR
jgi:ADP-ribose pyrophosphatase